MPYKPGDRVGALQSSKDGTVKLFGFGVYDGDFVPPAETDSISAELGIANPRITLDDGTVVWGCECWWGAEEKFKKMIEDMAVVIVKPKRSAA